MKGKWQYAAICASKITRNVKFDEIKNDDRLRLRARARKTPMPVVLVLSEAVLVIVIGKFGMA
ncbi:uncharacterized protein Dvar_48530 [Desulfosarcina variabilis str. Montpellier]